MFGHNTKKVLNESGARNAPGNIWTLLQQLKASLIKSKGNTAQFRRAKRTGNLSFFNEGIPSNWGRAGLIL